MKPSEALAGGFLDRTVGHPRSGRFARLSGVLCLTLLALGGFGGCKKKSDQPPPQPVASNSPPPSKILVADPSPPPMPPPPPKVVESTPSDPEPSLADRSFQSGHYQEAAVAYEADLGKAGPNAGPQTLIRLALAYQLGPDAEAKRERVVQLLTQALDSKPDALLATVATSLLALLERNQSLAQDSAQKDRRIRQLSDELERLKQIDLRRRPPGS